MPVWSREFVVGSFRFAAVHAVWICINRKLPHFECTRTSFETSAETPRSLSPLTLLDIVRYSAVYRYTFNGRVALFASSDCIERSANSFSSSTVLRQACCQIKCAHAHLPRTQWCFSSFFISSPPFKLLLIFHFNEVESYWAKPNTLNFWQAFGTRFSPKLIKLF